MSSVYLIYILSKPLINQQNSSSGHRHRRRRRHHHHHRRRRRHVAGKEQGRSRDRRRLKVGIDPIKFIERFLVATHKAAHPGVEARDLL